MPDLLIRTAASEDALQIAQLSSELGYPTAVDQMRVRLVRLADLPGHWVGVASRGAAVLQGWIHVARAITLETGECAEILGLVVATQARRDGIGRQLIAAAERWSGDLGLARVSVRSNVLRAEAHQFYPALGYVRTKSQHVYVKMLSRADPR